MPVKDGFTVLSEVKANDQYKTIPVIVTSNLSQKEDIDKAKGLGAADFIIKSDVSLDDLVKKVQNLLAGKPG
ncbi:MAG: Response regulator rcp1 [Candidatus Gottesmanbacteria bacterium GW2011_GWA1_44_24b]|uniref:Response regulator rcp1 n=2 Tax=Candidatus Gottesmaniibacteriota TaxID=1752720 RepID=A0A0G1IJ23_9BACT|nr:MAG: Response regulator rcp1 [Candidatus Gottesmanbacteria bacterium GW2011_GWA1_44_24b]